MEESLRRELFESMVQRTLEAFKGEGHVGVDVRELPHPKQDMEARGPYAPGKGEVQ